MKWEHLPSLRMQIPSGLASQWLLGLLWQRKKRAVSTSGHWERLHLGTGSFQKVYLICWANLFSSVSTIIYTSPPEIPINCLLSLDPVSVRWFKSRGVYTQRIKSWNSVDCPFQVATGQYRNVVCNKPFRQERDGFKKWKVKYMYFCPTIRRKKKRSAALQRSDKFISPMTTGIDKPFTYWQVLLTHLFWVEGVPWTQ